MWVIQNNLFNEQNYLEFVEAVERFEIPYASVKVVPFTRELVPDVPTEDIMIPYGSTALINVAKDRGWIPGAFVSDKLDFLHCLEAWGDDMLNSDGVVCAFEDVQSFMGEQAFIRPNEDLKLFSGELITRTEFLTWQEKVLRYANDQIKPDTLVVVAGPKNITVEVRFFFVGGEPVTWSIYKRNDRAFSSPNVDPDIIEFAHYIGKKWLPYEHVVVDLALCMDGSKRVIKVIEANCLNSAGWYACDVNKIVGHIHSVFS